MKNSYIFPIFAKFAFVYGKIKVSERRKSVNYSVLYEDEENEDNLYDFRHQV